MRLELRARVPCNGTSDREGTPWQQSKACDIVGIIPQKAGGGQGAMLRGRKRGSRREMHG
jgi:hypothetical protein